MRNAAMAYASSTSTDVAAYEDLPGHHLLAVWNLIATTNDESYHGSASELPPATSHGYAKWDFSGVPDPVMFQWFLDVADYWFGCSDDLSAESYDPACECFVVVVDDQADGTNAARAGNGLAPRNLGAGVPQNPGPSAPPTSLVRGANINTQLAQARELEAKLAEEYRVVQLLHASIAEEASARASWASRLASASMPTSMSTIRTRPRERIKSSSQPRRNCGPCPLTLLPRRRTYTARRKHSSSRQSCNRPKARRPAYASKVVRGMTTALGPEASVHAGGATGQLANQGRMPVRERILDTCGQAQDGDACNVNNARRTGNAEARAAIGYHPRLVGRYDSREDRSPTPEPPETRVFSREIRTASFPQRFHQPTSIDKYTGKMDPRVWLNDYRLACQLGDATTDEVIICNLPLHLADSARTWLEHLPPSQIHNWDDLVRTFIGNFQGTYVRPGNSWDLRACTQKPGKSLWDFIRRFSKHCTKLPSVA
jgi:hypothetical protein